MKVEKNRYDNWNTLLLLPLKKVKWLSPKVKTQQTWWRQTQSQHFPNTLHWALALSSCRLPSTFLFVCFLFMGNPGQCAGHFIFHLQNRNEIVYYRHQKMHIPIIQGLLQSDSAMALQNNYDSRSRSPLQQSILSILIHLGELQTEKTHH